MIKKNYSTNEILLLDQQGEWAGCLQLYIEFGLEPRWAKLKEFRCELVAISKGSIPVTKYARECDIEERTFVLKRYGVGRVWKLYNVLCVKWEDSVAHKYGIGRADESVWNKQSTEAIELVLG